MSFKGYSKGFTFFSSLPCNFDKLSSEMVLPLILAAFFNIIIASVYFFLAKSHRTDSGVNQ